MFMIPRIFLGRVIAELPIQDDVGLLSTGETIHRGLDLRR